MLLASLLSPASNGSKMPKQKEECSMQGKGPKGQNFLGLLFTKGSRRSVCKLIQIVIERLFFGSGTQFAPCPGFDLAHALT
jgi:hypothetical protein